MDTVPNTVTFCNLVNSVSTTPKLHLIEKVSINPIPGNHYFCWFSKKAHLHVDQAKMYRFLA